MKSSSPSLPSPRAILSSIFVYNIVIVTLSYLELARAERPLIEILIFIAFMIFANGVLPVLFLLRLFKSQHAQTDQIQKSNVRLIEEIDARKQIETALLENQQQFQAIYDNAQDAILLINQDAHYIGANPAATALLGYTYDEFLKLRTGDIAPAYSNTEKRESVMQEFVLRKSPSVPLKIEMRHKDGHLIPVEILSVPNILPNVHLGIVRDVSYRTEVEDALYASEERHRKVSELISDYAFLMLRNDDGTLRREWLTDSFYKMSGYDKDDPTQETGKLQLTHPDDVEQVRLDHARTLQGETTTTDCRFRIKSGDYIWLRVKREPIWDKDHTEVIGYYGAAHNITAEKEALASLKLSEERYRKTAELTSDYTFSMKVNPDQSLELEWMTNSYERITGYSEEEVSSDLSIESRTHPDDVEKSKLDFDKVLAGKSVTSEYRVRKKSGEYLWVQIFREPELDENGRVIRYYGASRDITAQKEAEIALRESETRYRKTAEIISDFAFSVRVNPDKSLKLEWMTPSYFRIMGYEDESQLYHQMRLDSHVHPDDLEQAQVDLDRVLSGEFVISEYRQLTGTGDYIWLKISRNPVIDKESGQVIAYYAAASDINAQKEAEIALRDSETRYRKVTESISDYAFSNRVNEDNSLELEWITPSFYRMMGYDHEDEPEQQKFQSQVHPEDHARAMADLDRVLSGEFVISEYRQSKKSGEYVWLQMSRDPVIDEESGRVIAYYGAARDITAQKVAEIALRESEARYRKTTEMISDYAFSMLVHEDGFLELGWITPSYFRLVGYESKEEVMQLSLKTEVHPDDYEEAQKALDRVLKGEFVTSSYRQKTKSGNYFWLQMSRDPVIDEESGRVIAYYGAARDITPQKEAEIALRESEDRYRKISEVVSDFAYEMTIEADGTMKILWVLGPFEEVAGFAPGSVGHISEIGFTAHVDDKALVQADIERTMQNQRTISTYRVMKGESYTWIRVTRTPSWNEAEKRVDKMLVAVSDVTIEKEAESIVQETERRYAAISRIISDFAFSLKVLPNNQMEDEWMIGSFEKIFGLPQETFNISMQWQDVTYSDDVARVAADLKKTMNGMPTVTEYRTINQKTKSIRWIRVTREPIRDETGQVIRIIGATKDMTLEKEAQTALIQSEERYRLLTEVISDYVFSLKVNDDESLENEWLVGSFEQITGMPIDNSGFGKNRTRTTHPDDAERVQADVERSVKGKKTVSEYRIINAANQQIRWIQVTRFPIWDEAHQRVIRILGAAKDITPQKEADAALRYSEERYRMLTTLMTDYAFSMRIDDEGNPHREWVVGSFEEITGISVHNLAPASRSGQTTFSADAPMLAEDIERTIQGELTITEYRIVHAVTKEVRWLRVTRHPIWNTDHSKVIQYIGAATDITAEKEAQETAHEADLLRQDLLRQKDLHELRSRFVSMVTHEFRNPLAAIQSSASILEEYNERLTVDKRQDKFMNIYRQIERLTNLLEDLLGVGELENKTYQFTPKRIDILEVVRDLLDEYRESIGKAHHLVLDTPHDKVTTSADYQLLHRAFGNIISNAIKYSPTDTTVRCIVQIIEEEVILIISDEGMGIPEADFDSLFEAFFRASNVGSKPGTGLGLIIAQQAIEIHNGKISFESKLGHGTTFTIRIPRVIGTDSD